MIFAPPMIMGYGNTNSVELYVQDKTGGSTEKLQAETTRLIDALSKRPEVSMPSLRSTRAIRNIGSR